MSRRRHSLAIPRAAAAGLRGGGALVAVLLATGCTEAAAQARTCGDPFAYCAAEGTLDAPETVYEWRCASGAPRIARQFATPDARGFLSNIRYEIAPPR